MSQAPQAQIPTVGHTPTEQRTLAGINELSRSLTRSGAFIIRPDIGDLVVSRSAQPEQGASLKWDQLNRASTQFDLKLALPQIDSKHIAVPLYFVKTNYDASSGVTFFPTGRSTDNRSTPLINDSGTYIAQDVRLYIFITDGQNWYVN